MEKRRKGKSLDYKELFTRLWCPLFGNLSKTYHSSILNKCTEIIYSARIIWGISDEWKGTSYPSPKLVNYPEKTLLSARAIFHNIPRIIYDSFYPGYEEPDNPFIDKMYYVVNHTKGVLEEIDHSKILSLLAIYYAFNVLENILYHGKAENNPIILRQTLYATNLISKANYYHDVFCYGVEEEKMNDIIQRMRPDAELGAKRRKQQKKFSETSVKNRQKEAKFKKSLWLEIANKLRQKFPNRKKVTTRGIAFKTCNELKLHTRTFQSVYKCLLKNNV